MTSFGSISPLPAAILPPETPISHSNLSLVSISCNDSNQDANSFWNSVENKTFFSLGIRPTAPAAQTSYDCHRLECFKRLVIKKVHRR